jgi:hypothetical protein
MATNNSINANETTPLPIIDGGTGVIAVPTAPAATAFAGWDTNKNLSANNLISGYTTTATAAGTTVLTVGSTYQQFFTGSTTQTVTLPVTSTLVLGQSFLVVNNSTGVVTVQSSGGNTVTAMDANTQAIFTCILTSGTTAGSWESDYTLLVAGVASITGTANQVIASASTGAVTLSTPQNIGTASAVQFGSLTFGGSVMNTYTANGSFTPTFSYATPGNLSVAYVFQSVTYTRVGSLIMVAWTLICTPTYTTASGAIVIGGFPFTAASATSNYYGTGPVITSTFPAGNTAADYLILSGTNTAGVNGQNNGSSFTTAQTPTGVILQLSGSVVYSI